MTELRQELSLFCNDGSVIARKGLSLEWWTFAGLNANQTIAQYLRPHIKAPVRADNLWITLPSEMSMERLNEIIQDIRNAEGSLEWEFQQRASDLLKFSDLLPDRLLHELIMARIADIPRAREILHSPIRILIGQEN